MSLQLAAKIGAAGTAVAGIPVTYFVWDKYFSFTEIEKAVLNSEGSFLIAAEDDSNPHIIVVSETVSEKTWKCKITGNKADLTATESVNKDDLINALKEKIPAESGTTTEEVKKTNKKQFIKGCIRNGIKSFAENSETSSVTVSIKKSTGTDPNKWIFDEKSLKDIVWI